MILHNLNSTTVRLPSVIARRSEATTSQSRAINYYEEYDDIDSAIGREKQIKNYSRKNKIELIEQENPKWDDLANDWYND